MRVALLLLVEVRTVTTNTEEEKIAWSTWTLVNYGLAGGDGVETVVDAGLFAKGDGDWGGRGAWRAKAEIEETGESWLAAVEEWEMRIDQIWEVRSKNLTLPLSSPQSPRNLWTKNKNYKRVYKRIPKKSHVGQNTQTFCHECQCLVSPAGRPSMIRVSHAGRFSLCVPHSCYCPYLPVPYINRTTDACDIYIWPCLAISY